MRPTAGPTPSTMRKTAQNAHFVVCEHKHDMAFIWAYVQCKQ